MHFINLCFTQKRKLISMILIKILVMIYMNFNNNDFILINFNFLVDSIWRLIQHLLQKPPVYNARFNRPNFNSKKFHIYIKNKNKNKNI